MGGSELSEHTAVEREPPPTARLGRIQAVHLSAPRRNPTAPTILCAPARCASRNGPRFSRMSGT